VLLSLFRLSCSRSNIQKEAVTRISSRRGFSRAENTLTTSAHMRNSQAGSLLFDRALSCFRSKSNLGLA
jgi:hypothetical protein